MGGVGRPPRPRREVGRRATSTCVITTSSPAWGPAIPTPRAGRAAEPLTRLGAATDVMTANSVAWSCALAPGSEAERAAAVRRAEAAYRGVPPGQRRAIANTLGAALVRAGRDAEAIDRLGESVGGGEGLPQDWAFLAMAHRRLGHRAEAGRWLDKLRARAPSPDAGRFWEEAEIRLLSREAEAQALDGAFPADPFAP